MGQLEQISIRDIQKWNSKVLNQKSQSDVAAPVETTCRPVTRCKRSARQGCPHPRPAEPHNRTLTGRRLLGHIAIKGHILAHEINADRLRYDSTLSSALNQSDHHMPHPQVNFPQIFLDTKTCQSQTFGSGPISKRTIEAELSLILTQAHILTHTHGHIKTGQARIHRRFFPKEHVSVSRRHMRCASCARSLDKRLEKHRTSLETPHK